jgi:phenylacetate-CoA ligase
MVSHAYRRVIHYREAMDRLHVRPEDFRTARDLELLPLVTRDELLDAPERFIASGYGADQGLLLHSSGTSGGARSILYDSRALFLALAHGYRKRLAAAQVLGKSVGFREIDLSRAGSVGLQLRTFYEAHSWMPPGVELRRLFLDSAAPFEEILARWNEFRPDVVRGYGSLLGAFFRWLRDAQMPFVRPKLITYGADQMAAADRELIERDFGIPVHSAYQAAEALLIAFQCERRQGFHISLDQVAVRVINREGRNAAPGESGEIILSNLTNRATVLLNIKLGDIVTLGSGPCPCGRQLPTIERIEGRADDLIAVPGGSPLHPLSALSKLRAVPGVVRVQIVQEELRRFQLRAVCAAGTDWEIVRQRLADAFQSLVGGEIELNIEQRERIDPEPSGKIKAVISRCAAAKEES